MIGRCYLGDVRDGLRAFAAAGVRARTCILAGSESGDVVLDPFMGSGTVAHVAQDLGRDWIGCEINPEYHAMIRERTRARGFAFDALV